MKTMFGNNAPRFACRYWITTSVFLGRAYWGHIHANVRCNGTHYRIVTSMWASLWCLVCCVQKLIAMSWVWGLFRAPKCIFPSMHPCRVKVQSDVQMTKQYRCNKCDLRHHEIHNRALYKTIDVFLLTNGTHGHIAPLYIEPSIPYIKW